MNVQPLSVAIEDRLAPIAMFVFKRPAHTQRALEALNANPDFQRSPLHIFCDAARNSGDSEAVSTTRELVQSFSHPKKRLHLSTTNQGLASSIIDGVTSLCDQYGEVIVLEDDLMVAPSFLAYMNRALFHYRNDASVMQVSGHMFPVDLGSSEDSVLLPFTTSWGWATWSRAWRSFDPSAANYNSTFRSPGARKRFDLDGSFPYLRMLRSQVQGRIDSWAIRWYLSVFLASGTVLYPRRSLVQNIGFDGSGTHCDDRGQPEPSRLPSVVPSVETSSRAVDSVAFEAIQGYLKRERGIINRVGDWSVRTFW